MRRLLITRGPPGSGKTTFIRRLGLLDHMVSGDRVRELIAGPELGTDGTFGRSQQHEARVWRQVHGLLDERMGRGELLVMDATHRHARDFRPYRELAHRHRYRTLVVDFSAAPLEVCLARNADRPELEVVPDEVVEAFWMACRDGEVPDDFGVVDGTASDGAERVHDFLAEPIRDVSGYDAVLHIGDLQGCAYPLLDPGGLLCDGLRPATLHVFVGDLIDRGPENDRVLRWMIAHAGHPDVVLLWGNHEDHLHRWTRGMTCLSREFAERTLPQLEAAGIGPDEVDAMLEHALELLRYRWRGQHVLVTHAGLPTVPDAPHRVSTRQLGRGPGGYDHAVDAAFEAQAPEGWVQVHGHRNLVGHPIRASTRSFNLEGEVEYGAQLRAVQLDAQGWTPITVRNRVFRTMGQRLADGTQRFRKILPPWTGPDLPLHPTLPEGWLDGLRAHALVRERVSTERPHIASFNFTRDAFFDAAWDDVTTTARGLFVDTATGTIAARSYDKFFNIGERPETRMEALERDLVFPVTLYVKENGYLGIVGYDDVRGDLLFASKSSVESEHAAWLRERLVAEVGAWRLRRIALLLRDTHASMVFEVIEPERDPHIIAYARPRLILLDVVQRATRFARLPYDQLQLWGQHLRLEVKERGLSFDDWPALARFLEVCQAPDWTWRGHAIEGFVLEDAVGMQTKIKLDYYSLWKRLRGLKDRVLRIRGTSKPLQRDLSDPAVEAFYDWCVAQPDAVLEQDIVQVRRRYLGEHVADVARSPPEPEETSAMAGLRMALNGLQRRLDAGRAIKRSTADAILGRVLADEDLIGVLRASPVAAALVQAATPGDDRATLARRLGIDPDDPDDAS